MKDISMTSIEDNMMNGKTVIVTGGTQGIGRETARQLVHCGAHVVLAVRDERSGERVAQQFRKESPHGKVSVHSLDLSSEEHIRTFAREFIESKLPLHALINNAGVGSSTPVPPTTNGIVGIVQVNYLGHYLLTRLLKERLSQSSPSRVVNVSSITHRLSDVSDVDGFLRDPKQGTYGNTKLANVLFTSEANSRWGKKHNITSVAVDPGAVASSIWRNSSFSRPPWSWFLNFLFAPVSDGAAAVVHAAIVDFKEDALKQDRVHRTVVDLLSTHNVKQSKRDMQPKKAKKDIPNFRLYARGMFAWPSLTKFMPSSQAVRSMRGFHKKLVQHVMGVNALLHASFDWPIRRLSGSALCGNTQPVIANLSAYDRKTSKALWEASAKATNLPLED